MNPIYVDYLSSFGLNISKVSTLLLLGDDKNVFLDSTLEEYIYEGTLEAGGDFDLKGEVLVPLTCLSTSL